MHRDELSTLGSSTGRTLIGSYFEGTQQRVLQSLGPTWLPVWEGTYIYALRLSG